MTKSRSSDRLLWPGLVAALAIIWGWKKRILAVFRAHNRGQLPFRAASNHSRLGCTVARSSVGLYHTVVISSIWVTQTPDPPASAISTHPRAACFGLRLTLRVHMRWIGGEGHLPEALHPAPALSFHYPLLLEHLPSPITYHRFPPPGSPPVVSYLFYRRPPLPFLLSLLISFSLASRRPCLQVADLAERRSAPRHLPRRSMER